MSGKRRDKKKESNFSDETEVYTGKLEITRGGMGFVVVQGLDKDIIVKPGSLGTALSGDTVKVEVDSKYINTKRLEGKITSVLQRKQTEFSGKLEVHPNFAFLIPDNAKMPFDIYIPLHLLNGAKAGDHATARITEWSGKIKNPVGEIINVLTNESINEIAMQNMLTENGFPLKFPEAVMSETKKFSAAIDEKEVLTRKDLRNTLTMTIDPKDAKDFDDAISFQKLKGGWYQVGVHIADVEHFIKAGSEIDKEAYRRATSVYLPDRVLPMLPEKLSNELCSLRPNEDKYTFSAIFTINKKGKVTDTWMGKTLIHSDRRYTYEEVQTIIEGEKDENAKEILILNEMAQNLRNERFKKGAINFSSQEVRFKLDETGKPIGIEIKESKEAHQLIEEFMLLANKTIATYVGGIESNKEPVPFPYRIHDVPNEDKLGVFTLFARRFGVVFDLSSPKTISKSFNDMLEKVQGKPEQHVLEQLGIRTMSKAVYSTDNIGHYGLGFEHYCHFTSPIRRYPDVLVHRILQQCLTGNIEPIKHLESLCRHCSDQERRAMDAERAANKYKQVEYMQQFVGDDFDAVISGVATFGFWAETVLHKCEGMVGIAELSEIDSFVFRDSDYSLVGSRTGLKFTMGDKVKVKVAAANLEKRQIDFSLVELREKKLKSKKNKKR